ncbi:MAG: c-type cytochrome [Deltaproteobacteria bacterium]|nr:c-type cytochrome [Deltaproteobacteria bacterium]
MPRGTDVRAAVIAFACALGVGAASADGLAAPDLDGDAQRAAGKELYTRNCAQCHGDKGDGRGVAAPHLLPRPRDFTSGKFKIRTTPSGKLPTDQDLKHVIKVGMPYTSMPGWPQFSEEQLTSLVAYVKSFAPDFAKPENQVEGMTMPTPPPMTAESVERGKASYAELGCARCHGELGRTDGGTAPTLKDDFDHPILPADLSRPWTFRGGARREDIFRAMTTGLNGTPMPAFGEALTEEQRWDITDYIFSLGGSSESPNYATLLTARKTTGDIDLAAADTLFDEAPVAFFPIVGQIMQPGRAFHPASNGLTARAVYNDTDLAIELRWNDMRGNVSGKNAPDIAVPPVEDAGEPAAAKPAAGADDGVWGDAEETSPAGHGAAADPWGDAEAKPGDTGEKDPWAEDGGDAGAAGGGASEFSDAVALQFPVTLPTSIRKPYFLFGDKDHPVHLWFVDLAKKTPSLWLGHGSDKLENLGARDLAVASRFEKGEWRVVFKRRLRSAGALSFEERGFAPIAFSVWDGASRERGNKRGLTTWWSVYFEPAEKPSPAGPMAASALGVLVLELAFVAWARRRKRAEAV